MHSPGARSRGGIHSLDNEERGVEHQLLEDLSTMVGRGFPVDIGGDSGREMDARKNRSRQITSRAPVIAQRAGDCVRHVARRSSFVLWLSPGDQPRN